jgi:hypothetical protein
MLAWRSRMQGSTRLRLHSMEQLRYEGLRGTISIRPVDPQETSRLSWRYRLKRDLPFKVLGNYRHPSRKDLAQRG